MSANEIKISALPKLASGVPLGLTDYFPFVKLPLTVNSTQAATISDLTKAFGKVIHVDLYGAKASGLAADSTAESAAINAAINAAYDLQFARIRFTNINTGRYLLKGPLLATTPNGQIPYITAADTTNDILTFNKAHKRVTGDVIAFQGHMPSGMTAGTQYFVNAVSPSTLKLYDTKANAVAGGTTGRVNITSDVKTTGSITASTTTLTVASAINAEVGTNVIINGLSNSNGGFFILDGIPGTSLTLNAVPANSGAATNAVVTFVGRMDPDYYTCGIVFECDPGVTLAKDEGFTANAIINITQTRNVFVNGFRLEALTPAPNASINAGDDLIRISSCQNVIVEHCEFFYAGDTACRIYTSTADPIGTTTSQPNQGVTTSDIIFRFNTIKSCHQLSTTTNDFFHGGAKRYWMYGNTFINLRGSVKFANRVPGGRTLFLFQNVFVSSLDKGFEIDSYENIFICQNEFNDIANYAVYILVNNGPADEAGAPTGTGLGYGIVGFPVRGINITFNDFKNCGSAGSGSSIRIQPDLYADGTVFDYKQGTISFNHIHDVTNTSNIGIFLNGGCYLQFNVDNNKFINYAGFPIRAYMRGSTSSTLVNNLSFDRNQIDGNNSSATAIDIRRTSGTNKINMVSVSDNRITGTLARAFIAGDIKNLIYENNKGVMAAGDIFLMAPNLPLENVVVKGNILRTAGASGWNMTSCNVLKIFDNITETGSGGNTYNIANTCRNVHFLSNESVVGTPTFNAVPINNIGLNHQGRQETGTAAPTIGTWRRGDEIRFTNVSSGGAPGAVCTTDGTEGSIPASTVATFSGSSNTRTFNRTDTFAEGSWIDIAGVSGSRQITAIVSSTQATVSGATPSAVSSAAVTYPGNAVFSNKANVA